MASRRFRLKLGKGVAFVKSELRRLRQEDDTWDADLQPLTGLGAKYDSVWIGLVVSHTEEFILAQLTVEKPPSVNDLAILLADAMRRPWVEKAHRPCTLNLRARPEWEELLPHLKDIGIKVVKQENLPEWDHAFEKYQNQLEATMPRSRMLPLPKQASMETDFPAVAKFVRTSGWIEIGEQEGVGFVAKAPDPGGLIFEDKTWKTLAEAMAALERGLAKRDQEEGIEEPASAVRRRK